MERKYSITMYAPLGRRRGTLWMMDGNSELHGTLRILGSTGTFKGTLKPDGTLEFSGTMTSLLRSFPYHAEGKICGSELELKLCGDRYSLRISGEEMKQ